MEKEGGRRVVYVHKGVITVVSQGIWLKTRVGEAAQ